MSLRLLPLAFLVAIQAGCASGVFTPQGRPPVITLRQLEADRAHWGEVLKKQQRLILSLKKGDRLPLDLTVDSPLVTLTVRDKLVVARDTCVYISRRSVALSPDCRRFALLGKGRALKKLFGLGKGSVSIGLSVNDTGVHLPVRIVSR